MIYHYYLAFRVAILSHDFNSFWTQEDWYRLFPDFKNIPHFILLLYDIIILLFTKVCCSSVVVPQKGILFAAHLRMHEVVTIPENHACIYSRAGYPLGVCLVLLVWTNICWCLYSWCLRSTKKKGNKLFIYLFIHLFIYSFIAPQIQLHLVEFPKAEVKSRSLSDTKSFTDYR